MKTVLFGALICCVLMLDSDARTSSSVPEPIARIYAMLEGKWKIELTMPGGPGKTPIKAGEGEELFYRGPGGLSLVENYHSTGAEGEISGLAVIWWSSEIQAYELLWCDNGSPDGCATVKGVRWEGEDLVAVTTEERDGKKIQMKEVFSKSSKDSFTQTIYQSADGKEWKVILTIRAVRAA
jgi:hypothetical protein